LRAPKSWEQADLEPGRAVAFGLAIAIGFFGMVVMAGVALRLGSATLVLGLIAAGAVSYLIGTAPRRAVKLAAFRQTVEAPSFAASSNIYLKSTSSRSKTLLMLRAEEPSLRSFLRNARRHTLLGYDAVTALKAAAPDQGVFSESIKTALNSVAGVDGTRIEEGAEELDGLLSSSTLDEETRLPLLVAAAFFLPIMLVLFASITKGTGTTTVAALLGLEAIILDIVLAISRSSNGWGEGKGVGPSSASGRGGAGAS
jgi:hypothetical protein